jgi:hypothetical protein
LGSKSACGLHPKNVSINPKNVSINPKNVSINPKNVSIKLNNLIYKFDFKVKKYPQNCLKIVKRLKNDEKPFAPAFLGITQTILHCPKTPHPAAIGRHPVRGFSERLRRISD